MDEAKTQTSSLPEWLRGTHEERLGIAGVCACYAGLFVLYALGVRVGLNWLLTLALVACAFLGTFHAVSSRLIDGAWPTLQNGEGVARGRLSKIVACVAASVVGLSMLAAFRSGDHSIGRSFPPGTYANSRKAELHATDLWENRSESRDGKTRTLVLVMLKDGRVAEDVVERTFAPEGSGTRMTGETLVWSRTVPSESQVVNFAVDADGTTLFKL